MRNREEIIEYLKGYVEGDEELETYANNDEFMQDLYEEYDSNLKYCEDGYSEIDAKDDAIATVEKRWNINSIE